MKKVFSALILILECLLVGVPLLACRSSETEPKETMTETAVTIVAEQATQTPTFAPPTFTAVPVTAEPTISRSSGMGITRTPTAAEPTVTLFPVCTAPACQEDEVYHCPGECPGGCGTECATPTAGPSTLPTAAPSTSPVILSFTADRTTIVEGESVDLTWQATGGNEAYIGWVGANALLAGPSGPLDPDAGTVTVNPTGDGDIWLVVRNAAGEVETHIQLIIECPYEWVSALAENPPSQNCPWEAEIGAAAQQSFEKGFMIWLEPSRDIYVFYYAETEGAYSTYSVIPDEFDDGDPESDPSLVPPDGLYQPVRGFGLVWRSDLYVRERLGWATAPEAGFQTWRQGYQGQGLHNSYTLLQGIDGTIYYLTAVGGVWEVYSP